MAKGPVHQLTAAFALYFAIPLFVGSAQDVKAQVAPKCIWNPYGSLKPLASSECPSLIDNDTAPRAGRWPPWTNRPECMSSGENTTDAKFCLFTYSAFHGDRPISIITTPAVAADTASIVQESGVLWEAKGNSPGATIPADKDSTYEVRNLPGKGKGVVARRRIQRGEVVMVDPVTMIVSLGYLRAFDEDQRSRLLDRAIELLPDGSIVMKLAADTGGHPVEDIFRTNSFEISLNDEPHLGIFAELAVRLLLFHQFITQLTNN